MISGYSILSSGRHLGSGRNLGPLFATMLLLLGAATIAFAQSAPNTISIADVKNIRFGVNGQKETRIVLDITSDVKYRVTPELAEDGRQLLVVELANTKFFIDNQTAPQGDGKGIGSVGAFAWQELALNSEAATVKVDHVPNELVRARIEFDILDTVVPSKVFMIEPKSKGKYARLVIDIVPASKTAYLKAIGKSRGTLWPSEEIAKFPPQVQPDRVAETPPPPSPKPTSSAPLAQETPPKDVVIADINATPTPRIKPDLRPKNSGSYTIAIDAGHGGRDPGAIGPTGTNEKIITLSAAKTLKKILVARGYNVVMTRDSDDFIDLDDRAAKARASNVDLFLSLHSDALDNKTVRGGSVYTISEAGAARIADEVRGQDDFQIGDFKPSEDQSAVGDILLDLAQKEASSASEQFAKILSKNMRAAILMVNNTHRQEDLKVLLAPNVPAVLLELAFISNTKDEKNLTSVTWRKKAMIAVADSIDLYFEDSPVRHVYNNSGAQ